MGYFIYEDELDTVDLGEGNWASILKKMSYSHQQKLTAHYVRLKTNLKGATPDINADVDLETGNIIMLQLNVKAWNLTDREGKPAPVDRKHLEMLDPDIAQKLIDAISERNQRPKAQK